jgi:hypothetical protein
MTTNYTVNMDNPIIEKAHEKFDEIFLEIFLVAQKNKISGEVWNKEFTPLFRKMLKIITDGI